MFSTAVQFTERDSIPFCSDAEPTLTELYQLKSASGKVQVIMGVAPCWYDLGILLNFDKSGTQLEIIKAEYHSEPVPCCRAMFQYWLNGNGRGPHSWRTLIELLEDSNLEVLAREVRNALKK